MGLKTYYIWLFLGGGYITVDVQVGQKSREIFILIELEVGAELEYFSLVIIYMNDVFLEL